MEYHEKIKKQKGYLFYLNGNGKLNGHGKLNGNGRVNGNGKINENSPFPEEIIHLVWSKAPRDNRKDPENWRRDHFGRYIRKEDFGKRKSRFGWVIDFIIPAVFGGTNSIDNLRPLNWQNKKRRKRYI